MEFAAYLSACGNFSCDIKRETASNCPSFAALPFVSRKYRIRRRPRPVRKKDRASILLCFKAFSTKLKKHEPIVNTCEPKSASRPEALLFGKDVQAVFDSWAKREFSFCGLTCSLVVRFGSFTECSEAGRRAIA